MIFTPAYHFDIEQGTPEWLAMRRGIITATGVQHILTPTGKTSKSDATRKYLHQLVAERILGDSEPTYVSSDMGRGTMLEPYAREIYSAHRAPVTECGFITLNDDNGRPVAGYSPDGLVGDDGLIEIKSRHAKYTVGSIINRDMPSEHVLQVQTGLAISGRQWCDFISYTPGLPLFVHRNYRDETLIELILAGIEFSNLMMLDMEQRYYEEAGQFPATEKINLAIDGEIEI